MKAHNVPCNHLVGIFNKSRERETLNLLMCADSSTNTKQIWAVALHCKLVLFIYFIVLKSDTQYKEYVTNKERSNRQGQESITHTNPIV